MLYYSYFRGLVKRFYNLFSGVRARENMSKHLILFASPYYFGRARAGEPRRDWQGRKYLV